MIAPPLFTAPMLAFALVMLPAQGSVAAQEHCLSEADHIAALQVFERGVKQYVELRRRLEPSLPPLRVSDAEEVTAASDALANAIRTARAGAQAGDIFCAEVTELFRVRIERTLEAEGYVVNDLLIDLEEEADPDAGPALVNGRFPWGRGAAMWPAFLRALPQLPPQLQYRFVGRDLVLLDIDGGLVIDVLKGALED